MIFLYIIIFLVVILFILFSYKCYEKFNNTDKQNTDETQCKFVSSRGILKSCDIHSSKPISSIKEFKDYDFSKLFENCSLYVCSSAIPEFAKMLDTINVKFYLVSGDADETCPNDIFPNDEDFIKFIENDKIISWYAQNCIRDHPKLFKLPIGLDYHSNVGHLEMSPIDHEKLMVNIKEQSKPFYEREIKCYSNFHFVIDSSRYGYDRKDAIEKIPKELMFYEPTRVNREESFKNQIKYAFVVSPHGNGLDCHRTWEALYLNIIPIVLSSSINEIYEDLPVLIINDWNEISEEFLKNKYLEILNKKERGEYNMDKLYLDYWLNMIN